MESDLCKVYVGRWLDESALLGEVNIRISELKQGLGHYQLLCQDICLKHYEEILDLWFLKEEIKADAEVFCVNAVH